MSRRTFTREFKLAAVQRLERGSFHRQRRAEWRIAELERKIGQQAPEIDFLKGCLKRIEEQRMLQALTGNPPSARKSRKK